ncbi:MAG: hypothetical protein ACYDH9_16250 [Limisphaerales bacterium]
MKSNRASSLTHALVYCSSLLFVCATFAAGNARHGAVATVHPLATDAAVEALERGGNAIEKRLGVRVRRELERRGHKVSLVDAIGVTQAVGANRNGAGLAAAHDPRAAGKATSW